MPRGKKKKNSNTYDVNTKECVSEAIRNILKASMFILLLLGMLFFPSLPIILFRINLDKLSDGLKILYNFICDVGYIAIIFLIFKDMLIKKFKEYFKNFRENFETGFKYYFIGFLIMIVSNLILTFFVRGATANNEETLRTFIDGYPLYMIFSVSIYAPFIEEMTFRYAIKKSLNTFSNKKFMKYIYIGLSGLIFGLMHVVLTDAKLIDYLYVIPYAALGCSFAALYQKTDNIFSSMMFHCLHNTLAITLLLIGSGI